MCPESCAHIPYCGMLSSSTSVSAVTGGSVWLCRVSGVDCNVHVLLVGGLEVFGNVESVCKMWVTACKYLLKVLGECKGENFRAHSLSICSHHTLPSWVFTQAHHVWHFQGDAHPVCPGVPLPPLSSWPCLTSASRWDPRAPLCHCLPHLQVCHFISISQMPSLPPPVVWHKWS